MAYSSLGRRGSTLSTSRNMDINVSHYGQLKAGPQRSGPENPRCYRAVFFFFLITSFSKELKEIYKPFLTLCAASRKMLRKRNCFLRSSIGKQTKEKLPCLEQGLRLKALPSFVSVIIPPPRLPAVATLGGVPVEHNLKTDQKSHEKRG